MLSALSGCKVANDEHEARAAYPYVCWEHPTLYPGIMVPVWAVEWRNACNRVGLAGFGREALRHLAKLWPSDNGHDRDERRAEELHEADDEDDYNAIEARHRAEDAEDLLRHDKASIATLAAIAVLDSFVGIVAEQGDPRSGNAQNAREAYAMKVLDVLEAGGLRYSPKKPDQEPYARDVERSKLLVATRLPGRQVPMARLL